MTWWTLLIVTFIGGPFDGEMTMLAYKDRESCLAALNTVSETLGYDHTIRCQPTAIASGSIRPQARPETQE